MKEIESIIAALSSLDEVVGTFDHVNSFSVTVDGWDIDFSRYNYSGRVTLEVSKKMEGGVEFGEV